ncbi:MAG: periplasmic heavy metal sensor [Okeania sp. SIO3B5]|uniref:Spy/CpxP family protein refolding chaperone n=1 Tax=Okeania sp. SIO3B5 TaxID=2607811 RepID=UPI0014001702|nr:periplasmic heavy metal sensor [Okeania sp. SIO3B5]NEO57442.1 periplasmic heavy metal sensor [Okeania sp. SIO3B5]
MSPALISALLGLFVIPLTISSVIATPNYNNNDQRITQTTKSQKSQSTEEGVFQQLNLTQEQADKIVEIRQQHQQKIIQSLENLRGAQEELNQMIIATNTDNQLRQKHDEVLQLRRELAELQFNTILKIREVLTPEQLQQWSKLMQQRRESLKNR